MPDDTREKLLQAAKSFCNDFACQKPPEDIFRHFSDSEDVLALEHGLLQLAPFLGREFTGQRGIREYFELISSLLKYENMSFHNFVVDSSSFQVSCTGSAHFTWSSTNQGWKEMFVYMLGFDEKYKVKRYEIWADTGAAYLASRNELKS